mmetsp:Transcript_6121/g.10562  ORF Transcript_6121/g.10562 Transcript_6121/m.10562 type:complete len:272 (-) Transcript_6121:427-1242(-)|eukprot:CAMPEP_0171496724 /NCGR_PEP_ID=MMETSP0958-20121227/6866_1 /TAXON_ID=87120 /ORGANISM="Aurantiochytrium limacinum, Strain ATCCMYA-1381" /LENGTH=271 /DNA_ID=CAMNT_0012030869 /DNA_START=145 /DNA_END=960 /DNA_ORIENTATION=+
MTTDSMEHLISTEPVLDDEPILSPVSTTSSRSSYTTFSYRQRTMSVTKDIINLLTFRRESSLQEEATAPARRRRLRSWSAINRTRSSSDPAKDSKTQTLEKEEVLKSIAAARFTINDLLQDEVLTQALTEFCEAHLCGENLRCLRAVQQLENDITCKNEWMNAANDINSRYVKNDAPDWVCLCPTLANNLEDALAKDDRELIANTLSSAKAQAKHTLNTDTVPRFVSAAISESSFGFKSDPRVLERLVEVANNISNNNINGNASDEEKPQA